MCACGRPLHYVDPENERLIGSYVTQLGPTIRVENGGGRAWMVPRHYIALHGLAIDDVPALAASMGWDEL